MFCLLPTMAFGQNKEFTKQHKYTASNDDSKNSAKAKAMEEAQAALLQELGVLVEARQTSVTANSKQDFVEEIKSYTIGKVQTQVVPGTENFTPNEKGDMIYTATFKMVVDTVALYKYLDGIVKQKEHERLVKMKKEQEILERRLRAKIKIEYEIFTDSRDGKKYKTINMPDGKEWMAENLNYDANGSSCHEDKPEKCKEYGRLYNWETSMKACPNGWHLPSKDEWKMLGNYIIEENKCRWCAKKLLMAKGRGWRPNEGLAGGTDQYGFTALPGGYGYKPKDYPKNDDGRGGYWWSSSEMDDRDGNSAYFVNIGYGDAYIKNDMGNAHNGFFYNDLHIAVHTVNSKSRLYSVRCVMD